MNLSALFFKKREKISSIFRLDIAVTNMCDSKCVFCNVWKIYKNNPSLKRKELKLNHFISLFKEVNLSWLHLTGGEPFLRKDFKYIAYFGWKFSRPFLLDIASNGQLTQKIIEDVRWFSRKIKSRIEIGISLDGTREIYKKIRGIDGFDKAIETFRKIKKLKRPNLHVHFNYIINPLNLGKLNEFLEFLQSMGIDPSDVSIDVARNAYIFYNLSQKMKFDRKLLLKEIKLAIKFYKSFNVRSFLRKLYLKRTIEWIKRKKRIPCYSGFYHYFVDAYGNLRPCQQLPISFGNIKNGFWQVVNSKKAIRWRNQNLDCRKCWTGCEGITSFLFTFPLKT